MKGETAPLLFFYTGVSIKLEQDKIFNNADLYDLAFSWDNESEIDFFKQLLPQNSKIVVAACGTGRHAYKLAQAGYAITAFDLHPSMLRFALLCRRHQHLKYLIEDMRSMSAIADSSHDAILTLNNSFRYLLTNEDAARHLQQAYRILKPNGVFLLELGLNDEPAQVGAKNRWAVKRDDALVQVTWTFAKYTPPHIVDKVELSFNSPSGSKKISEEQLQFIWSYTDLLKIITHEGFTLHKIFNAHFKELFQQNVQNTPGKYYILLKKGVLV